MDINIGKSIYYRLTLIIKQQGKGKKCLYIPIIHCNVVI